MSAKSRWSYNKKVCLKVDDISCYVRIILVGNIDTVEVVVVIVKIYYILVQICTRFLQVQQICAGFCVGSSCQPLPNIFSEHARARDHHQQQQRHQQHRQ